MAVGFLGDDMKKYSGKKLLILGSNVSSDDIVTMAKENGAYTIVADYLPVEKSFAKQLADDHVEISTADISSLCEYVKDNKIDAVLAGISEFNLISAIKVADQCGLRFYCDSEQWNLIEHKENFRELCHKFDIPTPETIYHGNGIENINCEDLDFPVVVKPVDCSASDGMHVCANAEELIFYGNKAKELSKSGKIIVEKYVNGYEFSAHYVIVDGKASLLSVDNRYPVFLKSKSVASVPIARVYPSLFLDKYICQMDSKMVTMCESIGIKNGVIFFQGFYCPEKDEFCIFEAGLRFSAECVYRLMNKVWGHNPLQIILDEVLLGRTDYKPQKEEFSFCDKACGVVSFASQGGVVGQIIGLDKITSNLESLVSYEARYKKGVKIPNGNTLRQLAMRFTIVSDSRYNLARDIKYLNESVDVLDASGNSMVIKFDENRLDDMV